MFLRREPAPISFSEEDLTRQCKTCGSGAGSLTWWRIRRSRSLLPSPHRSFIKSINTTRSFPPFVRSKCQCVYQFREHGIEPLLIKDGLRPAVPGVGMRPYGDIDLVVRAEEPRRLRPFGNHLAKRNQHRSGSFRNNHP